jgi:ATP synthase protein I
VPGTPADERLSDTPALRAAVVVTVVLLPVALLVGWLVGGGSSALGAGLGVLLVTVSFAASAYVVLRAARLSPQLMFQAAMATYLVKIIVLAVLLVTLRDVSAFDGRAFGWSVLSATVVWLVVEVRLFTTLRIPYVEPDRGATP